MKKVKVNKTNANTNKQTTKSFKTKTIDVELTNIQLYDDVSVTTELDTLSDMEYWAYHVEEELDRDLFDAARTYEDGMRDNLCLYTETELNDMIIRAGLIVNLFDDKDNEYGYNTHELCMSIIKKCCIFLNVLHGNYDNLKF